MLRVYSIKSRIWFITRIKILDSCNTTSRTNPVITFGILRNFENYVSGQTRVATMLGGILGLAFGFCIGSVGRFQTGTKNGICFAVSMFCCFCSGLMVGNMKSIIDRIAPWFNRINPTALITDSLYYLNIDSDYRRWSRAALTMTAMTVVLIVLGFVMSRRKKYASL